MLLFFLSYSMFQSHQSEADDYGSEKEQDDATSETESCSDSETENGGGTKRSSSNICGSVNPVLRGFLSSLWFVSDTEL